MGDFNIDLPIFYLEKEKLIDSKKLEVQHHKSRDINQTNYRKVCK